MSLTQEHDSSFRPSRRGQGGKKHRTVLRDDGAYQVDLVVAFFAILLVLFVVYSAHAYSEISERSRIEYHTKDIPSRSFGLKCFSAIYPFRDYWIIKDGILANLSMKKIAENYIGVDGTDIMTTKNGVDITLKSINASPTEFLLRVLIFQKGVPKWIISGKTIKLVHKNNEYYKGIADLLKTEQRLSLRFFVWDDQISSAQPLFDILRLSGIPFSVFYLPPRKRSFSLILSSKYYGYDAILRPCSQT